MLSPPYWPGGEACGVASSRPCRGPRSPCRKMTLLAPHRQPNSPSASRAQAHSDATIRAKMRCRIQAMRQSMHPSGLSSIRRIVRSISMPSTVSTQRGETLEESVTVGQVSSAGEDSIPAKSAAVCLTTRAQRSSPVLAWTSLRSWSNRSQVSRSSPRGMNSE